MSSKQSTNPAATSNSTARLSSCQCGSKRALILVTAQIEEWDADDEQVEGMGDKYRHLIDD